MGQVELRTTGKNLRLNVAISCKATSDNVCSIQHEVATAQYQSELLPSFSVTSQLVNTWLMLRYNLQHQYS